MRQLEIDIEHLKNESLYEIKQGKEKIDIVVKNVNAKLIPKDYINFQELNLLYKRLYNYQKTYGEYFDLINKNVRFYEQLNTMLMEDIDVIEDIDISTII